MNHQAYDARGTMNRLQFARFRLPQRSAHRKHIYKNTCVLFAYSICLCASVLLNEQNSHKITQLSFVNVVAKGFILIFSSFFFFAAAISLLRFNLFCAIANHSWNNRKNNKKKTRRCEKLWTKIELEHMFSLQLIASGNSNESNIMRATFLSPQSSDFRVIDVFRGNTNWCVVLIGRTAEAHVPIQFDTFRSWRSDENLPAPSPGPPLAATQRLRRSQTFVFI